MRLPHRADFPPGVLRVCLIFQEYSLIPPIIHQTWKDERVPRHMSAWQASWRRHHPGWEYRLWTDRDNRIFLQQHYPQLLPIYDHYPEPVMRADLVRYFILHREGGVYADLDLECLRPIDSLLAGQQLVLGLEPAQHGQRNLARQRRLDKILCNAFMASVPGHPFWDTVAKELQLHAGESSPLDATGPFMLTRAWQKMPHPDAVTVLESKLLYPVTAEQAEEGGTEQALRKGNLAAQAYTVHHWEGTWIRRDFAARLARRLVHHSSTTLRTAAKICYPRLRALRRMLRSLLRSAPAAGTASRHIAPPIRALSKQELQQSVLVAVPVKDAVRFLPNFFSLVESIDYPRQNLSLAFLESDSRDGTWEWLQAQRPAWEQKYRAVRLFQESFHDRTHEASSDVRTQLLRRAVLARSRNLLLRRGLRDEDWVLWLSAGVQWWPPNIIRCLLAEKRDIIVPHCVGPDGATCDWNTFRIAPGMREEQWAPYLHDGLLQPPRGFGRQYLAQLRQQRCVQVDAVGGAMLLVRADLHRQGLKFPEEPYRHYIETEGLAMLAQDMGHSCWGLPQLEIVHCKH